MKWLDFIFVRASSSMSPRSGPRNGAEARREIEPASRTEGARLLIAAGTGVVCLVVYASGSPSGPMNVDFPETPSSAGESPGAGMPTSPTAAGGWERRGLIERVRQLQLEDVTRFIVDDGPGTVAGNLAVRALPVGTPAWRLNLETALLGAATVSLLVAVMLHLGVARVAAVAAALAFALCEPIWAGALTVDPAQIRMPMLGLALYFLTLRTQRGRPLWPWIAGSGLWGISAAADPMVLCVLPGIATFMYLVERTHVGRSRQRRAAGRAGSADGFAGTGLSGSRRCQGWRTPAAGGASCPRRLSRRHGVDFLGRGSGWPAALLGPHADVSGHRTGYERGRVPR